MSLMRSVFSEVYIVNDKRTFAPIAYKGRECHDVIPRVIPREMDSHGLHNSDTAWDKGGGQEDVCSINLLLIPLELLIY